MKKLFSKIKDLFNDYKKLLRSIPSAVVAIFVLAVVLMNLMANKVVFRWGDFVGCDGAIFLSWIPFLCMDVVVKRFGPRAATKLNIFAVLINAICVGIFAGIAAIPDEGGDFSAFDTIFSCSWFILLASSTAMVVSGMFNNGINYAITKLFKNKEGRAAYIVSSYVSTFVAQFIDNFLFALIAYVIFGPIFWTNFKPFSILTCIGCGIIGAAMELVMEVIFSPIGYRMMLRWKKESVGSDYLNESKIDNNEN